MSITPDEVSVLYREPKLLKGEVTSWPSGWLLRVSVLYREPKLLKGHPRGELHSTSHQVSVLYREPKLLKGPLVLPFRLIQITFQCSTVSRNC